MEAFIAVGALLAIATFVTGLLLPLAARRNATPEALARREAALRAELAAGRQ